MASAPGAGPDSLVHLRHLLAALERLPDPAVVVEAPSGRVLMASAPLTRLLGQPPFDGVRAYRADGSPCPPEQRPIMRTLRTGEPVYGEELDLEVGAGRWFTARVTALPFLDHGGRMVAVAGTVVDVTAERNARRILAAALAVARALELAPDAARAAPEVLRALAEHLGWETAALLEPLADGPRLATRATSGGPGAHLVRGLEDGIAARALQQGRPEWAALPGAGAEPRPPHALCVPLHVSGEVAGVLALVGPSARAPHPDVVTFVASVGGDLANRLRREAVERDLQRSNARLRALIESAPLPFVVLDRRGAVLEWSRAAEDLYGWTREEMLGRSTADVPVIPEERRQEMRHLLERVASGAGPVREVPVQRRRRDGKRLDVSMSMAPIVGPGGQVEGTVAVAQDVTDRTRFLEIAAHELRNPMASVRAIAAYVRQATAAGRSPAELAPLLEVVESEVERLSSLLNEVIEGFRVGAGEIRVNQAPVDLCQVAEAAVRPFAAASGGRFRIGSRPAGPVPVLGDARRLEDVFRNLLANARKYSPPGGEITAEVVVAGERARVSVLDRGIGIPEGEVGRIFTPFFRASNLGASDPGGLGLGLYLCASIVGLHGGRIWAANRPAGGAAFHVDLPLLR